MASPGRRRSLIVSSEISPVAVKVPSATINIITTDASPIWKVPDTISSKPDSYHLQKSSIFVPHASPPEVAMRTSEALRLQSIVPKFVYDNEVTETPVAEAVAHNNHRFCIRLFRGKESYSHGVIVEIKFELGFSFLFRKDICDMISDAANSGNENEIRQEYNTRKSLVKTAFKISQELFPGEDNNSEEIKRIIGDVEKMILSPKIDSHILGMERLKSLVDTDVVMDQDAIVAVNFFFESDDVQNILEVINCWLKNPNCGNVSDKKHLENMLFLSLKFFSYAFSKLASCLEDVIKVHIFVQDKIFISLLDILKWSPNQCMNQALITQLASECVSFMINASDDLCSRAIDDGLHLSIVLAKEDKEERENKEDVIVTLECL